jgi:hypothetical protein
MIARASLVAAAFVSVRWRRTSDPARLAAAGRPCRADPDATCEDPAIHVNYVSLRRVAWAVL